tara:strand:+ start:21966 stop:22172 length:207 start_codon:yes stop_codon:yes gene_type:complete
MNEEDIIAALNCLAKREATNLTIWQVNELREYVAFMADHEEDVDCFEVWDGASLDIDRAYTAMGKPIV